MTPAEQALCDVMHLIETGWLVRSIEDDHEPGWAMRQLDPVRKLAAAQAIVDALAAVGCPVEESG